MTSAIDPEIDPVTHSLGAGLKERSRDMWISTSFGLPVLPTCSSTKSPAEVSGSVLTMKNSLH